MVTLEMRPDFTSSRNCEYSIGACAAWRVLNWLNTVMSTSPMTSQMTRFLSMLFKLLHSFFAALRPRKGILPSARTPRYHIGFGGFTPGSEGLYDFYLSEARPESRRQRVERLALERLDEENTLGLEEPGAKIDRSRGQLEPPRLVDVPYPRQVRRDVRKNHVGLPPFQGLFESRAAEIALKDRHP